MVALFFCSMKGPSHGIQSWTDPTWASHRPQLQALLQHGFIPQHSCFRHCSSMGPHGQQHPSPFPPQDIPSPWAASPARDAPEGALYELCLLQAPSITNPCTPPQLHAEICSMQSCILCAAGQPALLWASPGLQEPVALCMEHLFLSFSTDAGGCRSISSHFLTLPSQILLYRVFLLYLKSALIEVQGVLLKALLWLRTDSFWSLMDLPFIGYWASLGICSHRPSLHAKKYEPIFYFYITSGWNSPLIVDSEKRISGRLQKWKYQTIWKYV